MNQNFFLHGKLFKIFNTLQKGHFWTFPPVQFSTICQNTSFWTFFWNFQHLAKNSKHASFWTFFPAQCLVGRHKFAKLQICVLTKIKRTSKIQSVSKNNLINSKEKEQAYFGTYKKYDCKNMSQRKNLQTFSTQYKFINLQPVLTLVLRVDTVSH